MEKGVPSVAVFILISSMLLVSGCSFFDFVYAACNAIGGDNSDHCIQWAAVKGSDEGGCEKIKGEGFQYSNPPRDKCYLKLAEKKGDTAPCDSIEGGMMSYTKEECYGNVAQKEKDPDKCAGLGAQEEAYCRTTTSRTVTGSDGKPDCGTGFSFDSSSNGCVPSKEEPKEEENTEVKEEETKETTPESTEKSAQTTSAKEAEPEKEAEKPTAQENVEPEKAEEKQPEKEVTAPEKAESKEPEKEEKIDPKEVLKKIEEIAEKAEETKESMEKIMELTKEAPIEEKLTTALDELSKLKSSLIQQEIGLESKIEKEPDKTKKAAYMLELEKIKTEQKAFNEDLDKETNSWWTDKIKSLFGSEEEESEEDAQQKQYDEVKKKLEAVKKGIEEIEDMKKKGLYDKLAGEPLKAFVIIENGIEYVKYVPLAGEVAEKIYGKSVGAFALKAKKVAIVSTKARDCQDASRVLDDDCIEFANQGGAEQGWR